MYKNKTYLIKYQVFFMDGAISSEKIMKVTKCISDLQAKSNLENYIKRKYLLFSKIVINKCIENIS